MAKTPRGIVLGDLGEKQARGIKVENGNQGFNTKFGNLGGDSQPGPGPGVPLQSRVVKIAVKKHETGTAGNPFNEITKNIPGVLGPDVVKQNAGQYKDSPVPLGSQRPEIATITKADEARQAESFIGNEPNKGGVLDR